MSNEVNSFTEILWHRGVWLPPNTTWEQIEEPGRAQFSHLAYPLPLAFLMMVLRFFLDRCLYRLATTYWRVKNMLVYVVKKATWESAWH